jgi:hypothetical protein
MALNSTINTVHLHWTSSDSWLLSVFSPENLSKQHMMKLSNNITFEWHFVMSMHANNEVPEATQTMYKYPVTQASKVFNFPSYCTLPVFPNELLLSQDFPNDLRCSTTSPVIPRIHLTVPDLCGLMWILRSTLPCLPHCPHSLPSCLTCL